MSEWRQIVLDDLIRLQRGYDLATPKRKPGGIPVIGAGGISGWHDTAMAKGPGVVVGRAGASMGHATYSSDDFWPLNTSLFVTDFRGNDPRFVYYLLTRIDFSGFNSGAAQPMLNRNYIKQIPLRVPSLAEQKAIAVTLGALDDKVAVNDRIVRTFQSLLENQARATLNASSRRETLGKLIDLKYGKALKVTNRNPGTVPVYGGNGVSGTHDTALVSGPGIIVGRKGANAGSVSWSNGDYWPIDTAFYVAPLSNQTPLEFLLFLLKGANLPGMVGDSAIPGLNRKIALSLEVSLPEAEKINEFSRNAQELLALQAQVENETNCLAELRDILLPKLLCGEIRIRDAEKAVEDAV